MTVSLQSPTRPPHPVVLDRDVFEGIISKARAAGVAPGVPFVLVELDDDGMRGAVVDAITGECLIENADMRLRPRNLDRAVADYMVREARVPAPTSAEEAQHLVDLTGQAREKLAERQSTFVIGDPPVGLMRIDRTDFSTALADYLRAVDDLVRSLATASPKPIGAVAFTPEHRQWPGLAQAMHRHSRLPILALGSVELAEQSARHTGEQPVITRDQLDMRPGDFAVDNAQTQVLPRIDTSPRAFSAMPPSQAFTSDTTVLAAVPGTHNSADAATVKSEKRTGTESTSRTGGFRTAGLTGRLLAQRREQNRKVMIVASVIAVLCVVGATLIAAPWRDDSTPTRYNATPATSSSQPNVTTSAAAPAPPPSKSSAPSAPKTSRPRPQNDELGPVAVYTPPPPKTTTRPAPTQQQQPPQRAPQRPTRRAPPRPRCGNILGIPLC